MKYSEKLDAYIFDSVDDINKALTNSVSTINDYIFNKIKDHINSDIESLVLFYVQLDGVLYNVKINRSQLISPLKKCLNRFEDVENYEKCIECQNLIKMLENS